ncbi:hypothetical protein [Rhodohalobacter sp.]|uniref:hypothetical protein n=1 Tax=Rhodohalobacter sp. TaxID=1974210 RepID=UPI002ACE6CBE|nr:hypothetical protein [Rhodohalobacter sp.]MDZ7757233.1 hypothetical protein [Rhodohalobacter sp.]
MENNITTNGFKEVDTKKNATVTLKSTDRSDLFSVIFQEKVLGYINTKDVNHIKFVPISEEIDYSLTELEKITSSLKKARQMKQQQVSAIENFLN